jgi:hypothetical protein
MRPTAAVKINDTVIYDGRRYVVVGFDPMSVSPQRAYLRDAKTGEERSCLYEELVRRIRDAAAEARPESDGA